MLSKKTQDALNAQINAEFYSSYLYLSMSAYAEKMSLKGMAHWFRVQSQEEMAHVMKLFDFVINRRGVVDLKGIGDPPTHWDSPLAAFEAAMAHEELVTGLIYKLVELSITEHDHPCHVLLEWFVNEQVEEEAVADQIVQRLKMAGDAPAALLMIDAELGARGLAPPSTAT